MISCIHFGSTKNSQSFSMNIFSFDIMRSVSFHPQPRHQKPFDTPSIRIQLIISHDTPPRNFLSARVIVLKRSSSQFFSSDRLHVITCSMPSRVPISQVLMCFLWLVSLLNFMPFSLLFPDNYNVQRFHVYHQHLRFNSGRTTTLSMCFIEFMAFNSFSAMGKSINRAMEKARLKDAWDVFVDWLDCLVLITRFRVGMEMKW